ncbi:MAG: TIGR01244 family phosphatase [Robiginitomaculum sp.]|nr:MAG: TIGR01244 family phosphatase [Robiginitomaculum sp.]
MDIKNLSGTVFVSPQISSQDLSALAAQGITTIINNRPDGEAPRQPKHITLKTKAEALGVNYHFLPITPGKMSEQDVIKFAEILNTAPGPILAFCRTGTRSTNLWAQAQIHTQAGEMSAHDIIQSAKSAGYDLSNLKPLLEKAEKIPQKKPQKNRAHDIVIVGGGSAGLATAASLLKRRPKLDIAIIEPSELHYYQPGWTMVGGGIFTSKETERKTRALMPKNAKWIKAKVSKFHPDDNTVALEDGSHISYKILVAAPGLQLDFDKIEGLEATLGQNGVTSNYRYDLASYTWELVQNLKKGTAIFTQPPMPIKCAGAPQKAMYLSGDHWFKKGVLENINIEFCNAGGVLFGVKAYVPALMEYIKKYRTNLNFSENLIKVDGPNKIAWFEKTDTNGKVKIIKRSFDMLHICPPQSAPEFIKSSPLANAVGWIDVDPETLHHVRYPNIYALGDACSTPNAKTMAAARKQAPIVATNVIAKMEGLNTHAVYDGYGSCPLTVERGKIILAEFGYGGKILPSFPKWFLDGTKPTRLAWILKEKILPPMYWKGMLKGKEWLVKPDPKNHVPTIDLAE